MERKRYMVSFSCQYGIFEIEEWGVSVTDATFHATRKLIAIVNDVNEFSFKNCVETPEEDDEDFPKISEDRC